MATLTEVESGKEVEKEGSSGPHLTSYAGHRSGLYEAGEDNVLSRLLGGAVHGMFDFLRYTILRPGSGAWRMTTQISEEAEKQRIRSISSSDDPSRLKEISDIGEINPYLRALSGYGAHGDPYGILRTGEFLLEGGGRAAIRGAKEGFLYSDIDINSAWDITDSGTGETRAMDWMLGPAGPGAQWVEQNKKKATALAVLMDIGYDPITIFPSLIILPIKLTVQALVKTVKGLHKMTPGAAALTEKMADKQNLQRFLSVFGVYLGKSGEVQNLFVESAHLLRADNFYTAIATRAGRREIKAIADRLGISYEDFTNAWRRGIEGDPWGAGTAGSPFSRTLGDAELTMLGASTDVHPAILAQRDISHYRHMLDEATSPIPITGMDDAAVSGVKVGEISGKRAEELGVETYFPHKNVTRSLAARLFGLWGRGRGKVGSQIERKGIGTAEEKGIVEGVEYVLDPVLAKGLRTLDQNAIMAAQNFLRKAAERWGRTAATAPEGWLPVEGIRGVLFQPHVARILERNFKTLSSTAKVHGFEKFVDGATRWWKMWALALRPSYHARNLFGNMWNSYAVGGMTDASMFGQAQKILFQSLGMEMKGGVIPKASGIPRFSGSVKLGDFGNVGREDIFKWMMEDGIVGVGRYFEEDLLRGAGVDQSMISSMNSDQKLKAFLNIFNPSTHNTLLRASFRGGRAIENWNRAALYLDALKRTGSRRGARDIVNDALFDYTNISPTAARWMRNKAAPFYTWYYKNSPAIIKGLFRHAYKYKWPALIKENIEYGEDIPTYEQLSDFAKGRDPVFVQKFFEKFIGESGREDVSNIKRYINMLNYWPASDLNRFFTPGDLIAELSNPFVKMLVEQMWGKGGWSFYGDRPISKIPGLNYGMGEMKDFLGLRMPARLAYFLHMFPLLSEIDRVNPDSVFGRAEVDPATKKRTTTRAKFEPFWQDERIQRDEKGDAEYFINEDGMRETITTKATLRESKFDELPGWPRFVAHLLGLRTFEFDKPIEFYRESKGVTKNISKTRSTLEYYYKKAIRDGNLDAAQAIAEALNRFFATTYESDPLKIGTSRKRLEALGQ